MGLGMVLASEYLYGNVLPIQGVSGEIHLFPDVVGKNPPALQHEHFLYVEVLSLYPPAQLAAGESSRNALSMQASTRESDALALHECLPVGTNNLGA